MKIITIAAVSLLTSCAMLEKQSGIGGADLLLISADSALRLQALASAIQKDVNDVKAEIDAAKTRKSALDQAANPPKITATK